jgi:hypothetical protein
MMRDMYDVMDDLFTVFENIHKLFCHWTSECSDAFIAEVLKLDPLEKELAELTGDWKQACLIRIGIYRSIFPHVRTYKPSKL